MTIIDHYAVLCLPSGEGGAKLTLKEIVKAYRKQSLICHPDKRPDDPNATADFRRLKTSFEVLEDEAARRVFDASLRSRRERFLRDSFLDAKRRKLATDLEERERAVEAEDAADPAKHAERREKDVAARLQEELAEFQARKAKKPAASTSTFKAPERKEEHGVSLDKERILKVSWDRDLGDYSAVKLRELFESFGGVEDVVIRSKGSRKKGSAIIVMSSKDAAAAATHNMCDSLSNPLLVLTVQAAASDMSSSFPAKSAQSINPKLETVIGAGFQDYEASIMRKLQKVAATQNMCGSLSNPLLVLPVQAAASDMSSSFPAKSAESINPKPETVIGAGFQDYEASIIRKLQKE